MQYNLNINGKKYTFFNVYFCVRYLIWLPWFPFIISSCRQPKTYDYDAGTNIFHFFHLYFIFAIHGFLHKPTSRESNNQCRCDPAFEFLCISDVGAKLRQLSCQLLFACYCERTNDLPFPDKAQAAGGATGWENKAQTDSISPSAAPPLNLTHSDSNTHTRWDQKIPK